MCGIAGLAGVAGAGDDALARIRVMCSALEHRGPDDEGVAALGACVLGMRRLSIIDLACGQQPLASEDGSVSVVCNGEIYNHAELRRDLERRGHVFASRSDVAVIPHLYEEYGDEFVTHLRGMFALALWDGKRQRLVLARDRLGKKPLYYAEHGGRLVFASELKALLASGAVAPEVDWTAIGRYLVYNRVPSPSCAVRGVQKLAPAHYLVYDQGAVRTVRYWRPSFAHKWRATEREYLDEVERVLADAVRVRLMSDVPLGAFLSGGVDSGLVVALMAREMSAPVKTFSIGFADQQFSELPYARRVARHVGADHHEFVIEPDEPEILRSIVYHLDEPFADASAVPTHYVSRLARQHVAVALTGDGGDESFGGYEWYLAMKGALAYQRVPSLVRRALSRAAAGVPHSDSRARLPQAVRRAKNFTRRLGPSYSHPADLFVALSSPDVDGWRALLSDEGRRVMQPALDGSRRRELVNEYDGDSAVESIMYSQLLDMLPDLFFVKVDRMSMMNSLEARSPFADHLLVELAARIPFEFKVRGGTTKYLLKKVAERYLPRDVIHRQKMGFSIPVGRWMREGRYREFVHDVFASRSFRTRGLFDLDVVDGLLADHVAGRADHWPRLWNLLCLELWLQQYASAPRA